MKKIFLIALLYIAVFNVNLTAQTPINAVDFFKDDRPLNITITTDIGLLVSGKLKDQTLKSMFAVKLPDADSINEEIDLTARGHMRRSICNVPPIGLNFTGKGSPTLAPLKKVKLVTTCKGGNGYDQLLLKEYLIYKIYNMLTEKSFRVRLANFTYLDNKDKKKSINQYGFMVENVDALAKRLKCKEINNKTILTEATDREQMTMVAIFEYFIGNTDWSVPNNHNIKLLDLKGDSTTLPYPVAYDFDYSGLVNADYAVPDPLFNIENVTERLYRGFPRTMPELEAVLKIFTDQKENIIALIKNFELLDKSYRSEMISYINDFYSSIKSPRDVQNIFISNARKQ
jgi:hypothetical protein